MAFFHVSLNVWLFSRHNKMDFIVSANIKDYDQPAHLLSASPLYYIYFLPVSGWHRRINGKAGRGDLGFYVLVPLLLGEAETVNVQMRLVSENLLTRTHRQQYRHIYGKLFDLWDQYDDGLISTNKLLRACSQINGLGPTTTSAPHYY